MRVQERGRKMSAEQTTMSRKRASRLTMSSSMGCWWTDRATPTRPPQWKVV
jgi:hypothetical protein